MAAYEELTDAIRVNKAHLELFEYLSNSLQWIVRYCIKNNIPLPEAEKIQTMIDKIYKIDSNTVPKSTNNKPFSILDDEIDR
jgi:hypothetical protein